MDMGLYRCLPYLSKMGMGQGKSEADLKAEHPLVVGARVWMTVSGCVIALTLAVQNGIRARVQPRSTCIALWRGNLVGRSAIPYPSAGDQVRLSPGQLVRAAFLQEWVACFASADSVPLHQPFSIAPTIVDMIPDFDEKLRKVNQQCDAWFDYWDEWHSARGIPPGDLLREGLVTFRAGTM